MTDASPFRCTTNNPSSSKLRPASSISLLAERLKLSSLNEPIFVARQQNKTELLAVEKTALHIRRMSNHRRSTIEDLEKKETCSERAPRHLFSSNLCTNSGVDSCHPKAEHDNQHEHWTPKQEQADSIDSTEDSTEIGNSNTPPDAACNGHTVDSFGTESRRADGSGCCYCSSGGQYPPAKRACRSSSATCDLYQNPPCFYNHTSKCPTLESHMNTLLRPVAIRLTPISKQSNCSEFPSTNVVKANGVNVAIRARLREHNRASRLSWHHPLFCSETDSRAQHPSYGVQIGCSCHACDAGTCSSKQHGGSEHAFHIFSMDRFQTGNGRYISSACKPCNVDHQNSRRETGSANSFSESDYSNSSGVESLHCSHPSAFTPTSARFESPHHVNQSFTYSVSPGINSVSSPVPISVPTPSSGFQDAAFSCFSDASSSLPDCSSAGFRWEADTHPFVKPKSGSAIVPASGVGEPLISRLPEDQMLQLNLGNGDDTIRCRSQPTAIQRDPTQGIKMIELPFSTKEGSRDATTHWVTGLKRRRGPSGDTDFSNANTLENRSFNSQSDIETAVVESFARQPSVEFQYAADVTHIPVRSLVPVSFTESPSSTLPNGVFVFGSVASQSSETSGSSLARFKTTLHSDSPAVADCTISSCCKHGSQFPYENSNISQEKFLQAQQGRCTCTLHCSNFTHETLPHEHGYFQLGELSESMEEEKEYETPETITEEATSQSSSSWNRSKHPTVVSPSIFDMTFEPIRADEDTNAECYDNTSNRRGAVNHGRRAVANDPALFSCYARMQEGTRSNSDAMILLSSSTDSETSDSGTPFSNDLITRRKRRELQSRSLGSPQIENKAGLPLVEIDLELMEND